MKRLNLAIAELSVENTPTIISRVGLQDTFPESGEAEKLLDEYQMSIDDTVMSTKKV